MNPICSVVGQNENLDAQARQSVADAIIDPQLGMIFWDTRPWAIDRIKANIRKLRAKTGRDAAYPQKIYRRVLEVTNDYVRLISPEDPCALDEALPRAEFLALVRERLLVKSDFEPLPVLRLQECDLTERQKQCRDRNLEIIRPLIELESEIFEKKARWRTIESICSARSLAPVAVYRVLRRYLHGGMLPQALAGRWFRRVKGIGRGTRSISEDNNLSRFKRGRHRLDGLKSFPMTSENISKILRGAGTYFYTPDGGNWQRAWLLTIAEYYLELDIDSAVPIATQLAKFPPEIYPSFRQFRYHVECDPMLLSRIRKRLGERKFQLTHRRLSSKGALKATGPGSHYQIDPTPLDYIVVHRITRRPIGRVVLYLVVDVFSHLITGFYVHVGNPGFEPASLALLAAAEDKVELCRRFEVEIPPDEWPVACLCGRLLADSELASFRAHALVENDLLKLTIVPPYRADLKGLVEALNGTMARKSKHVPGYTKGQRQRAEISADATAALDYQEVNQVVIHWIRARNRMLLRKYPTSDAMLVEGVEPRPISIWTKCVPTMGGLRRQWPMEQLMKLCLPTATAHITRWGIEFQGMTYEAAGNDLPDFELWCVQRVDHGSWPVTVTFHPARAEYIWLHKGSEWARLRLTKDWLRRVCWSYADLVGSKFELSLTTNSASSAEIPFNAMLAAEEHRIVKGAKEKTEAVRGTVAQRRREKVDKPEERQSQQLLIKLPIGLRPVDDAVPKREIQDEEEAEMIQALKGANSSGVEEGNHG
jgi:putative transposase